MQSTICLLKNKKHSCLKRSYRGLLCRLRTTTFYRNRRKLISIMQFPLPIVLIKSLIILNIMCLNFINKIITSIVSNLRTSHLLIYSKKVTSIDRMITIHRIMLSDRTIQIGSLEMINWITKTIEFNIVISINNRIVTI